MAGNERRDGERMDDDRKRKQENEKKKKPQ
jgi:hypothetical protein